MERRKGGREGKGGDYPERSLRPPGNGISPGNPNIRAAHPQDAVVWFCLDLVPLQPCDPEPWTLLL